MQACRHALRAFACCWHAAGTHSHLNEGSLTLACMVWKAHLRMRAYACMRACMHVPSLMQPQWSAQALQMQHHTSHNAQLLPWQRVCTTPRCGACTRRSQGHNTTHGTHGTLSRTPETTQAGHRLPERAGMAALGAGHGVRQAPGHPQHLHQHRPAQVPADQHARLQHGLRRGVQAAAGHEQPAPGGWPVGTAPCALVLAPSKRWVVAIGLVPGPWVW